MQIVSATSKCIERRISGVSYSFWVRVWSDDKNLTQYEDVLERFSTCGLFAQDVVKFVEGATGYEFEINEEDVEFAVGAVFRGVIQQKITYDGYGPNKNYHISVVKHLGYCEIEGGERK